MVKDMPVCLEGEARNVLKYERLRLERLQEVEIVINAPRGRIESITFVRDPEASMREGGAGRPTDQIAHVACFETRAVKKILGLKILYRPMDSPRADSGAKDPKCILVMVCCDDDA